VFFSPEAKENLINQINKKVKEALYVQFFMQSFHYFLRGFHMHARTKDGSLATHYLEENI
jgi:hypothetical protein